MYLQKLGASKAHFYCRLKDGVMQYKALPRHVAYVLQEPFRMEFARLQEQQILAPLGVDETTE